MYKQASKFHRHPKRTLDHEGKPPKYGVVTFRVGKDNQGREIVYRNLWVFRQIAHAAQKYERVKGVYGYAALISYKMADPGFEIVEQTHGEPSDPPLLIRWVKQRKGVNKNAHPFTSARYFERAPLKGLPRIENAVEQTHKQVEDRE